MPSNNVGCYYEMQMCCIETAPMRVPWPWPYLHKRSLVGKKCCAISEEKSLMENVLQLRKFKIVVGTTCANKELA